MVITDDMKRKLLVLLPFLFIADAGNVLLAQWSHDFRHRMEIPEILNVQSSETHLYVLSDSEGLIVFRAHSDSLQWLYSSTGMQQRGHIIESDIRFAYIFGNDRRLTVVEPTSVLGVYSATVLPHRPLSVERIADDLYIAMGDGGLGKINLETPESVDESVEFPFQNRFERSTVQSLVSDRNRTLYVLSNDSQIDIFSLSSDLEDEADLIHEERVATDRAIEKIFLTDDELIGTDREGNIFLINSDGRMRRTAHAESSVERLKIWNDHLVVRTESGQLWIGALGDALTNWKSDSKAGNFFTSTGGQLWVSEFNQISPVVRSSAGGSQTSSSADSELKLSEIPDITIPFPRALILPIRLENNFDPAEITFSYSASFNNAQIRGNTFYWQPSATQTGRHRVTITAVSSSGKSDSREFTIDLKPFNSPPRFSPARPISVPVGEAFEYKINAVDPDGMNQDLIRYLGVDLPDGAMINEKTGLFTWTPNVRQVGSHSFQVIATDQYGAAASQDYEIRVVEIDESNSDEDF